MTLYYAHVIGICVGETEVYGGKVSKDYVEKWINDTKRKGARIGGDRH